MSKKPRSGRASKAKGAKGERIVRRTLERDGWLIPEKQTTGLAGDDLFARDPEGTWWSIEVKHTVNMSPAYMEQAKSQAQKRAEQIRDARPNHPSRVLGIEFDPKHWMLLWVLTGWGNGRDIIAFKGNGRGCGVDFLRNRVNGKVPKPKEETT